MNCWDTTLELNETANLNSQDYLLFFFFFLTICFFIVKSVTTVEETKEEKSSLILTLKQKIYFLSNPTPSFSLHDCNYRTHKFL